jgi:ectoine hydroxylase-related dioxygenase (phytanoyl-CoA dioxygenase family)
VKILFGARKILSPEQLNLYRQDGFLLVSGLIRHDVVERAYHAMLRRLNNAAPATRQEYIQDPAILSCFSREVRSAAAQLVGSRFVLKSPVNVHAITVFSTPPPWRWPAPHIDHAIEQDAFRTYPAPFRIGCMIYLNQVTRNTGGTVVWPGSHRQIDDLAVGDPRRYEYLSVLYRDIGKLTLRNPREITASRGDVLFLHRFCAHSGSMNVGGEPRLALNHKW